MKQLMTASGRTLLLLLLVMIFSDSALATNNEPAAMRLFPISDYLMGGDVLRPGSPGLPWHIGLDGGITYSSFYNGPIVLAGFTNPYNSLPAAQRYASISAGSGLGFTIGGTIDYSINKKLGIVGKLSYNTRSGKFSASAQGRKINILPPDTVDYTIAQDINWDFKFLSIDLLLRVQLLENSLYLLVGPSFSSLSSNTAKLDEKILTPNFYYQREDLTITTYTSLSAQQEMPDLNKSRIELKAGIGWWIPIQKKLYLTPEVMMGFPLTNLSDHVYNPNTLKFESTKYNYWTIFATVGLRWEL